MSTTVNKRINLEKIFESIFLLLNILIDVIEISFSTINFDPMVSLSFLMIQVIAIVGIFLSNSFITPSLMFWIAYYWFFFFVPTYQYFFNKWEFLNSTINSNMIFYTNILLLIFGMTYIFGAISAGKSKLNFKPKKSNNVNWKNRLINNQINISILITIVVFVIYFTHINYNSPIGLIYSTFGIAFPAYGLLIVILEFRKLNHFLRYIYLIFFIIVNFYLSNPLISSRWWGLSFVLAIFLILFWNKLKKYMITIIFLIALLFLGVMGVVTHAYNLNFQERLILLENSLKTYNPLNSLTSGQFDAYENFVWTTKMCQQQGLTDGRQLLGAMLFFIPRSWWSNKPVGSGQLIGEYLKINYGMPNTNLANPIPSEGYINFGIVGVGIFGFVFGFLLKKAEKWRNYNFPLTNTMYFLLTGLVVFITRGDLMSSFAYTFGVLFSGAVLNWISNKFFIF